MSRVLISDLFPGNTGDMIYNNGNNWVRLTKGLTSQVLTLNSDGLPEWGSGSSYITSISDTSNINLDVTGGVLKADFISQNISQFTNNSGYLTGTGTSNEIAYLPTASTIGSLTTATYPSLTELSYIKGVTSNVQTQITNITYPFTIITSDVTTTSSSLSDVTGLSFPVTSGHTYRFSFVIPYTSSATANGAWFSLNGASVSLLIYRTFIQTTTSQTNYHANSYDGGATSTSSSSGNNMSTIEGMLIASATGNVIARFASEVATTQSITVKAGASVYYKQLD